MLRSHLKLLKSESLEQHDEAGGLRTSNEVVNGKLNDVFRSITEVDYARSAFEVVKLYPSVTTTDSSKLADAHIYLSEKPSDPLVNTLIVESTALTDETKLASMKAIVAASTSKFHGLSVLSGPITAGTKTLNVDDTHSAIFPRVTETTQNINVKAYEFSPMSTSTFVKTRTKTFTAPSNSNVALFNVDVTDYFEPLPDFTVYYLSANAGWRLLKSGEDANEIKYENGQFVITLNSTYAMKAGSTMEVVYHSTKDYRKHQFAIDGALNLAVGERILANTFRVKKAGESNVYTDANGVFVDNGGSVFAQANLDTGVISPAEAVDLTGTLSDDLGCIVLVATTESQAYPSSISFSIRSEDYNADSLRLVCTRSNGTTFSVSADLSGNIAHVDLNGSVDNGYVSLTTSAEIASIYYDVTTIQDSTEIDWLGLRSIPGGGIVQIFNETDLVCIQNRERTAESTLSASQVISIMANADYVDITDSDGQTLHDPNDANYSYDETTGNLTINAGISNFTAPYIITAVQHELQTVTKVENGQLSILTGVERDYPAGSVVSSVQLLGDLQALALNIRTQSAWNNDYDQNGAVGSSSLNFQQFPMELNNVGAINQKWAIVATSSTAFYALGESVGNVGDSDILSDFAPINPKTLQPYFVIRKEAFSGWLQPGECLLFETTAAARPTMISRAISPGHSNIEFDSTTLSFKGYV